MSPIPPPPPAVVACLDWQHAMGLGETLAHTPGEFFQPTNPPPDSSPAAPNITDAPDHAPTVPLTSQDAVAVTAAAAAEADSLEALRQAVHDCQVCALKHTATNTVFGEGNPQAPLVIIGEGPGADEDRSARPFTGPSGKLLNAMLNAIACERPKDTFISNAVYWRPPGNRTPSERELDICRPFVLRLISLIQPQMVLLLGTSACKCVLNLPAVNLGRLRDTTHPIPSVTHIPAIVSYHPSFLLRSPLMKRRAWHDALRLKTLLDGRLSRTPRP